MKKRKKLSFLEWILIITIIIMISIIIKDWLKISDQSGIIAASLEESKKHKADAEKHEANAEYHSKEAGKYRQGMEKANSDAAEKDKKLIAQRLKTQGLEKQLKIIMEDPPCKDLNLDGIDLETVKLKFAALCKIGEYMKELNKSYKFENVYLQGIIKDKNEALFNCQEMAGKIKAEAMEYKGAVDDLKKAIKKFETVTVPAMEKENKRLKRKRFFKYLEWFLYGTGTGGLIWAIFGRK